MLLEKLSIENYGVYADKTTFVLSTTPKKPIILVGGLNGAGKSTIFECIMIALYGRSYLGRRITNKDYEEFIANKIHKYKGKRASHTSIEIAFRFYHNGNDDEYVINRSWIVNDSVLETFLVYKNGKPMNDIDESQWQSFIEGLIPLGIAQLFFFDGEKIVKITKWDKKNSEIKSSLETLLGTDIVKQLNSDLELYLLRRAGKNKHLDVAKYEKLNNEKKTLSAEIDALVIERNKKNTAIQELNSTITLKEQKILDVGGGYANIRENLLTQRSALEEKLRHQRKIIIEELSDDAPLYLISSLLERIKKQVEIDVDIIQKKASTQVIKEKIHDIKKQIQSPKFWPANIDVESASSAVLNLLERTFVEPKDTILFDVSPNESVWMIQKITNLKNDQKSLQQKITEYEKTMNHFTKVETELSRIPRDDEIGPQISEINTMYEELGILKGEISHIDQNLSSKRAYYKILQNRIKDSIKQIHKDKSTNSGIDLASRMKDVLVYYSEKLLEKKIIQLESNLLDIARLLLHKEFIHHITIDRKTFEIKAYDSPNSQIPGGLLSMGERQIVGTALLWALARTSGRSLPFVIDTPIGRLDGEHLTNLTNRFYPHASHQIILLSTDREIGPSEYEKLSNYISRSYRIIHEGNATTVTEGYFMEKQIA